MLHSHINVYDTLTTNLVNFYTKVAIIGLNYKDGVNANWGP